MQFRVFSFDDTLSLAQGSGWDSRLSRFPTTTLFLSIKFNMSKQHLQTAGQSSTSTPKTLDALTASLNETRLHSRSANSNSQQADSTEPILIPSIHDYLLSNHQDHHQASTSSSGSSAIDPEQAAISQLSKYLLERIDFNQGEVLIKLGQNDDGIPLNLEDQAYLNARNRLSQAAKVGELSIQVLDESMENDSTLATILVRRLINDISNLMEVRIACAGELFALGISGRAMEEARGGKAEIEARCC